MSKRKTWADVREGNVVELAGARWTVVKIKPKGKVAKVRVEGKGRQAKSEVRLKGHVVIVNDGSGLLPGDVAPSLGKRDALRDEAGTQQRWAKDKELEAVGLNPGDARQTRPPAKAKGSIWTTPADRIESAISTILGARLVGESGDESVGWYVPPVDVSTIAAHLIFFHGIDRLEGDEAAMLKAHAAVHEQAAAGKAFLHVNHWHTERRP